MSINFLLYLPPDFFAKIKIRILKYIFDILAELNISFVLPYLNNQRYLYTVFYFKGPIVLICKPYLNKWKFPVSSF